MHKPRYKVTQITTSFSKAHGPTHVVTVSWGLMTLQSTPAVVQVSAQ